MCVECGEDMPLRLPSYRVRVTFKGDELPEEKMYQLLRPFGRIQDIIIPPPSKDQITKYVRGTSVCVCVECLVTVRSDSGTISKNEWCYWRQVLQ